MKINPLKIKVLLSKKNMTQKSLSDLIDIPKNTFSAWMNRGNIPDKYISSLNKALEIDLEQYFNDDVLYVDHLSEGSKPPIPYYGSVDITAGDTEFWNGNEVHEPTARYVLPDTTAEMILPVVGNSMSPRIEGGDKVAVKQITDFSFFNYGQEYVIITEDYRLIKQIRKHKDSKFVILHSHNSTEYDDIDLPIKKILHLFLVVEILKKNQ